MIKNLKFKIESCKTVLFYSILALLPSQLGKHFWPSFSYVSGIRVDYLSPTLYVTDILILCLFISWSISNLRYQRSKPKFKSQNFINLLVLNCSFAFCILHFALKSVLNWKTFSFLTFFVINIFLSNSPLAGIYGLLKLGEFVFFGFYVSQNINKKNLTNIILIFSFGVIFESILGVAQYLYQSSIGGLLYFLGERTFNAQTPGIANASLNGELMLRPYGTFPHPNVLAGYLTIAMTLISSKFKVLPRRRAGQSSKFKTILHITSLALGSVALFLTMSRVAIALWLILVMLNLFQHPSFTSLRSASWRRSNLIFVLRLPRPPLARLAITILFIGIIIVFILISPLRFRFIESSFVEESLALRMQLIQSSLLMIRDHSIFGVGINNFLTTLPFYTSFKTQAFFQSLQPVHNIFLLIAAETGILGFTFFLWFLYKTLKNFKFQISNFKYQIFLIIIILGVFDHYFLTLQQGRLLLAFAFGLLWAHDRINS